MMRVGIAALMICGVWACQPADKGEVHDVMAVEPSVPAPLMVLTLTDGKEGPWTLDVRSAQPTTLFFSRSKGDYRTARYTSLNEEAQNCS
jgi:hypothetical protein